MKFVLFAFALLGASQVSLCQDAEKKEVQGKDGGLLLEIACVEAFSFVDDNKRTVSEFKQPTLKLFRSDNKGGRVKGTTLKADQGKAVSEADGVVKKIMLSGNVRAEEADGTVITANEAVVDLLEETLTFKKSIKIVTSEK